MALRPHQACDPDHKVAVARSSFYSISRRCNTNLMRVDTTVVETNVHYPTDSSLLGDGVRVPRGQ